VAPNLATFRARNRPAPGASALDRLAPVPLEPAHDGQTRVPERAVPWPGAAAAAPRSAGHPWAARSDDCQRCELQRAGPQIAQSPDLGPAPNPGLGSNPVRALVLHRVEGLASEAAAILQRNASLALATAAGRAVARQAGQRPGRWPTLELPDVALQRSPMSAILARQRAGHPPLVQTPQCGPVSSRVRPGCQPGAA
jgi:hypothetical protein